MLSAKSGDIIYRSGNISNPKSRQYTCVHCPKGLTHVSRHERSGESWVCEHFRHPRGATHAIRSMSNKQGEAIDFLIARLSDQYAYEILTDQIYSTSRGDIPTDVLVREHFADKAPIDTIIQVESDRFKFADMKALHEELSRQGVYFMPVLCAKGSWNPNGQFFRDEFRNASGEIVKVLKKNELALYDRIGAGIYFDYEEDFDLDRIEEDRRILRVVKYRNYEEYLERDIVSGGYVIKRAGERQTFKTKKKADERYLINGDFKIARGKTGRRLIAIPRHFHAGDFIQREALALQRGDEDLAYEFGERAGIMLCDASDVFRRKLTKRYGAEKLGAFALEPRPPYDFCRRRSR